jgi:hypothetical protein
LFVFNKVNIPSGYVETKGVIIDVEREMQHGKGYYVEIIEYEVNDEIYTTKSNWKSRNGMGSKTIGSEIVLFYNIENPEEVILKNIPVIVNVVAIIIDIVFGVVSIILISAGIKKSQKEKSFNIENYQ